MGPACSRFPHKRDLNVPYHDVRGATPGDVRLEGRIAIMLYSLEGFAAKFDSAPEAASSGGASPDR